MQAKLPRVQAHRLSIGENSAVRRREQPEAVGPSEERAIQGVEKKTLEGKQPTEGLTNKQMKESKKQHSIVKGK